MWMLSERYCFNDRLIVVGEVVLVLREPLQVSSKASILLLL
jgi:hypothetical protein